MKYEFVHKDAVKLFERSVKSLEKNEEGSIYPYEFSNGVGITIDHVKINRDQEGRIVLNLDEECGKDYMEHWKASVGGVLVKDIKKGRVFPVNDLYYTYVKDGYRYLLRSLSDDEYAALKNDKYLTHLLASVDFLHFLIIKCVEDTETFSAKVLYSDIDEPEINIDEEEEEQEEEEDVSYNDYTTNSLFDDEE